MPLLPAAVTTDNALARQALHRLHQRIGEDRLEHGVAEREVDDLDAVGARDCARPIRARRSRRWCCRSNRRRARAARRCRRPARCRHTAPLELRPLPATMPATCVPWPQLSTGMVPPLTKSLNARMRLERQIGVRPNAGVDDRDGDAAARRIDRRRLAADRVTRAPGGARRLPARRHARRRRRGKPGVACANSLLNAAALPKHHERRSRLGIGGAHGGAAIEQAIERGVALRGRRNCMITRARAGRPRPPLRTASSAWPAADGTTASALKTSDTASRPSPPGESVASRIQEPRSTSPCKVRCKTSSRADVQNEPGYLTPAQLG